MHSKIKKALLAIAGGALAFVGMSMAGGGVTVAGAETVRLGNIQMSIDGQLSPSRLPARRMAPASLTVRGSLTETEGEQPQPLQFMDLHFDRAGTLFTRGLPTCEPARLENTLPDDARQACGDAMVGRGYSSARVEFPDQAAFNVAAPEMMIFNAPGNRLVVHAYAVDPLATTFVVPVHISESPHPRFGVRSRLRVPEIAGGSGSLTHFRARLGRTWNFRGNRRSFIYASCPQRVHLAHGMFRFQGGPVIRATVRQRCQQRR